MTSTSTLGQAVRYLAGVCDGAALRDGQGYNMMDKGFGHQLAQRAEQDWTPRQRYAAWKMLAKYAGQLAQAGIAYSAIPAPDKPAERADARQIDVTKDGAAFLVSFAYHPDVVYYMKQIPGRQWVPAQKIWTVAAKHDSIAPLSHFISQFDFDVTDAAAALAEQTLLDYGRRLEQSRAAEAEIVIPGLAGELYPFQKAGVRYALDTKRCFIADEMGLGKTVQGIATTHAAAAYPALVITPASLKLNWEREIKRWVPDANVAVLDRDSWMLWRTYERLFVVINYDIMTKWQDVLEKKAFRMLILDESHYVKNHKAQRTKAVKDVAKGIEYRLALSGTPLLNRPSELISQLQVLDRLKDLGGFYNFAKRYCGADPYGAFGFDMSGAKNLDELNRNMRATCYIRRNKAQVLKELPAKRRSVVTVDIDNRSEYEAAAGDIIGWLLEHGGEGAATSAEQAESLVRIERLKQMAARGKMRRVVEWVNEFLDSGEKLVIFAQHREIQQALLAEWPDAARLFGEDAITSRQAAVDRFQTDPKCRLFIASLRAAGVGITLTAASNVAFVELGWTPGEHDQAEDRCHRIGQDDSVTAWYLIGENTIDEDIQAIIEAKRKVVDATTEGDRKQINNSTIGDLIKRLRKKTQGGSNDGKS